jgi:hypothetical protein
MNPVEAHACLKARGRENIPAPFSARQDLFQSALRRSAAHLDVAPPGMMSGVKNRKMR